MSISLRKLQDEAAKVIDEIEGLRAMTPADDTEAATIDENLAAACQRSDELIAEIGRQQELEQRRNDALSGLKASLSTDSVEKPEPRRAPAVHVRAAGRAVEQADQIEAAGRFLRSLSRGEVRAMAEGSAGAGAELTAPAELYSAVINVINRQSVGIRVASVFNTVAKKLTLPKVAEGSASFYSEAGTVTPADLTTSGVDVTLFGIRSATAVSNDLIEDSVVDVGQLFTQNTGNAFATAIDTAWLQGNVTAGIDGLVGEVTNSVSVTGASDTTYAELAEMVGAIDPLAANTAWVVSPAGMGALLAAHAGMGTGMLADAMAPQAFGRPVYVTNGLPSGTLALYGDFSFATAVAVKASGLRVEALRELQALNDRTVYVAKQRVGIANHAPEFVAKLVVA